MEKSSKSSIYNHSRSNNHELTCANNRTICREIGSNLASSAPGLKTIDATGKLVMPGGIDANTYLEHFAHKTRTADDFYTGTCAALAGGTTTISTSTRLQFI